MTPFLVEEAELLLARHHRSDARRFRSHQRPHSPNLRGAVVPPGLRAVHSLREWMFLEIAIPRVFVSRTPQLSQAVPTGATSSARSIWAQGR
ncbi:hypothetical protein [Tautonia rosea]|uniref:hypothetical protein n=1 Tax=Tautonia rosea TaxID=2728037 RepID=UPI0014728397|nr:hypothetical protein [Tautonia rosea]